MKSIIAESGIPYVVKHVVKHVVEHKNKTGVRENHKKGQNCTDCNSRNCKTASFFRTVIALTKSDNGQNKPHNAGQAEKKQAEKKDARKKCSAGKREACNAESVIICGRRARRAVLLRRGVVELIVPRLLRVLLRILL